MTFALQLMGMVGCLAVLLGLLPAAKAQATKGAEKNLVTNSGFEDGLGGWGYDAHGADGRAVVDATVRHSGAHSLLLTNATATGPNVWYRAFRTITAQPYTTYRMSCWIKGEESGSGFIGGGPGWGVRIAFPEGTFDWKELSMEWSTGASAEDFDLMLLSQGVTKKCWIDDVQFTPIRTDDAKLAELSKSLDSSVSKQKELLTRVQALAQARGMAKDADVTLGTSIAKRFIERIERLGLAQNMSWSTLQIEEVETVLKHTQARIEQQPSQLPGARSWPAEKVEIQGDVFSTTQEGKTTPSPFYSGGYGHFNSVFDDLPNFRELGVSLIQDGRHGPSSMNADGSLSAGANAVASDLKRAAAAGVKVDVILSPHYFPQWAYDQSPDVRNGNVGFIDFNIDHPKVRETIEKWIRAFAATLKGSSALFSYCLTNEPAYVQSGKDPYSRPKFVKYLLGIHGEIATLNALYVTTYKTFDEVPVPATYAMPAKPNEQCAYYDWCRFNQVNFTEWHRWMNQIVKSIDPAAKTHIKALVIHAFQQNLVHFGVDPELMCEVTDVAGCDNFVGQDNTALTSWTSMEFYYDLLNSFRNQPVFNSESHFIPDGLPPSHIPGENSRAVMWQSALHHVGATTIWVWNEPAPGLLGSIYLRPANIHGVGQALLDANRLSRELAAINQARPRVALLYSQPSIFWESGYGGSIMNLHTQLKFAGEKVTFVSERQLAAGLAPKVDVIITSLATHVDDKTIDGLRKFAKAGGKVLLCGENDLKFDEYHRGRTLPMELQNSARLPASGGVPSFIGALRAAGLSSQALKDSKTQADLSGIEYRIVDDNGAKLVPLMNFTSQAQTLRLPPEVKGDAIDLLSGRPINVGQIELSPMVPMLLRVTPPPTVSNRGS
jgi:hypothetical protein